MINLELEDFVSSYLESIQVIPIEMQRKITSYLQSDLQQRHLLVLSKCLVEDINKETETESKIKSLEKLIYFLAAIQDICDRRIGDLDELDEFIENYSQRLLNARAKVDTANHQNLHTTIENTVDSDMETSDHETNNFRTSDKISLLRRNVSKDLSNSKGTCDSAPSNRNSDAHSRGRERLPLRAVTSNNRATSRRSISRWSGGIHRKSVTSNISSSNHILKQNGPCDQRVLIDQRQHKLGSTYARYSRTQQQRIKNHRTLSRPIHTGRSRVPKYSDSVAEGNTSRKRKGTVSRYLNIDSYQRRKQTPHCGKRRQDRNQSNVYFVDSRFDRNSKSASDETSDEEKSVERDAYTLLGLSNSRRMDERTSNWMRNVSENEASDELDGSDSVEHNVVDNDNDQVHDTKQIGSQEPSLRKSPLNTGSSLTADPNRQRIYRLRRTPLGHSQSDQAYNRSILQAPNSSPDITPSRGSFVYNANSTNNTHSAKRGSRSGNVARVRVDSQQNVRASPDSPRHGSRNDDSNMMREKLALEGSSSRSLSEHTSEASGSPDERLYCICKKVSFGDMIACDNKFCEVEWFHFACVDVRVQPKGKWYCPYCRGESSKIKRSDL